MPLFVIGADRGGSIEQLGSLKALKGQLTISRLEQVEDEDEAKQAKLHEKENLHELAFEWDVGRYFREFDKSWKDQQVLEALEPHRNIKKMKIDGYLGEEMPSWMLRVRSDQCYNHLVDLSLLNCVNCEKLPRLGNLPGLKFLKIHGMHSITFIDDDFYGIDIDNNSGNESVVVFPSLKVFSLLQMQNLSDWRSPSEADVNGVRVVAFPCLEEVSIGWCRSLTAVPLISLGSVAKLEIRNCDELSYLFDELPSFPCLTNLCIESLGKLTCLPNGLAMNSRLTDLSIRNCDGLESIPEDLGNLTSLASLEIRGCRRLSHFPDGILCRFNELTRLTIGHFSEWLDDFSYLSKIVDMPSVRNLEIWGPAQPWIRKVSLPNQLQRLTSLSSLSIRLFSRMETLPEWFVDLQFLQFITIISCDSLDFHSTAPILQRLSKLRKLTISSCHLLEKSEYEWKEFSQQTNIKVTFAMPSS